MGLPYWSKPCRAQWRCGRVTALPIKAPVPAPITPPAMAPPALPPETADPMSAPVPAPIAPSARVPVVCCDVWQPDTGRQMLPTVGRHALRRKMSGGLALKLQNTAI
jgi:hypothetical protein